MTFNIQKKRKMKMKERKERMILLYKQTKKK